MKFPRVFLCLLVCQIGIINLLTSSNCSDIIDQSSNETTNQNIVSSKLSNDEMYDYLGTVLTKPNLEKIVKSPLIQQDLQIMCGLAYKQVALKQGERLFPPTPRKEKFFKSVGLTTVKVSDAHALNSIFDSAFCSPKKTMTGHRVVFSTPEARQLGMSRQGLTTLRRTKSVRTSPEMAKKRLEFNRETVDYEHYVESISRKRKLDNAEEKEIVGLTRSSSARQKALMQSEATTEFFISYVKWIEDCSIQKIPVSRELAAEFFLNKFSHFFQKLKFEVNDSLNKGKLKTLYLYYNPYDFDKFGSEITESLMRLRKGQNPKNFHIHHLTMSQAHNDILVYIPEIYHTDKIHRWSTDITEVDRGDFNRVRKFVNNQMYHDILNDKQFKSLVSEE